MSFRAAVTTSDGAHVDLHFGQATRFFIIDVEEDGSYTPVEWRDAPERHRDAEGCHGWFDEVAKLIPDVDYVLTARIGPKPHRSLSAADRLHDLAHLLHERGAAGKLGRLAP